MKSGLSFVMLAVLALHANARTLSQFPISIMDFISPPSPSPPSPSPPSPSPSPMSPSPMSPSPMSPSPSAVPSPSNVTADSLATSAGLVLTGDGGSGKTKGSSGASGSSNVTDNKPNTYAKGNNDFHTLSSNGSVSLAFTNGSSYGNVEQDDKHVAGSKANSVGLGVTAAPTGGHADVNGTGHSSANTGADSSGHSASTDSSSGVTGSAKNGGVSTGAATGLADAFYTDFPAHP